LRTLHDITDPRLVKALAHPLRIRILAILEERVASPSQIAEELDAPLGNVSYHVRQLADLGLIKLVKETPVRGTLEHHYRAEIRPRISDRAFSTAPDLVKQATVGATLGQIGDAVNRAAAEGGFGRADAHLSRLPLLLDEDGWKLVSKELESLVDRIEKIQRDSGKRLMKTDHEGQVRGELVTMLFEATQETTEQHRQRATDGKRTDDAKRARARS
jgi:DNA-binding transcriptional ArsR family regulator